MKSLLRNSRALSPVASAIILIVVTITVSILVAAWMGALTFTFVKTYPHLDLKVSPPGYPQIGGSWSLSVYKGNFTEEHPVYELAENATVVVDLLTKTNTVETYVLLTDEEGMTSFQYLEEHSEVCFQAFLKGFKASDRIALYQRYVPPDTLSWLSSFSVGCLGLALGGGRYLAGSRKSLFNRTLNWTLLCIMSISSFILASTIYSFLFKSTWWGFPSEIIGPVVTFETLKYSAFVSVLLYLFVTFLLYLSYTKESKSRKLAKGSKKRPAKKKASAKD